MSSTTFTINGVECSASGDKIDLRDAGFLKTSIPKELLNHPQIKTILLCHEDVLEFLESIIDNFGPPVTINVFNDDYEKDYSVYAGIQYDNYCGINTDELGFIGLNVRCNAVNVVRLIAVCKRELRRLALRNYECGVLDGLDRTTLSDVEELIITSNDKFSYSGYLPEIYFKNINLKTSFGVRTNLDTTSQCNTISLEGMTNLHKFLLCAKGKKILPTGMDQLNNLQELFIFDDPIGEDFELSEKLKLRKFILFNYGLKVLPLAITGMEELEVLELWHNDFHDQSLSLAELVKLKHLVIRGCSLDASPVGLENLKNLERLDLSDNSELGQRQSFSISQLQRLRYLNMRNCGLKTVPYGFENCIGLRECHMSDNKLKELPESFANLIKRGMKFNLAHNILVKPPQVLCDVGRNIVNYFKNVAKYGEAHKKRLRVLVIGNSGAGKTSLVNSLLMGKPTLTEEHGRTEGIEIRKWSPDPANENFELEIWDFGGQMEYQSISHYFFSLHSLFLLAVEVSKYETTDESYHENAGKWIDELKSIVRRPVVMIAATKSDLLEDSEISNRCQDMLERIKKQEKLDMDSIKSDLKNLDENDNSNTCRKEKLNALIEERPVLPKEIIHLSELFTCPANGETCIVVTSARRFTKYIYNVYRGHTLKVWNLNLELLQTGNDTNLFPHLKTTLPHLWVEIEKLLPTLREEMKDKNYTKYLTFEELEKWLCQHLQLFNEDVDKKTILQDVLSYLVKLGKVLHFEHVKQLRDFIFPDPQWLIMLVKEVVHHDLESHLQFREEFKSCNMVDTDFNDEKSDLIEKGLLSESLLRCIWFDAVPNVEDFKKLVTLLFHFDVGYKVTDKEAGFEGKESGKNYILIPALMSPYPPAHIKDLWPGTATNDEIERSCEYKFLSNPPVGLFERQMVRSHHRSDYSIHWKEGFFGINWEGQEEVKFCITKTKDKIELTARIMKSSQINTLWKVVLSLHQIFADMVQELWPELRYGIYNKCPECDVCHYRMDFEQLLKAPDSYRKLPRCKNTGQIPPVKVNSTLVIPPPEVVKEFQKNKSASTEVVKEFQKNKSASTGIEELNDPPPISVTIPELRDVNPLLKAWEDIKQPTDVLLLVADEEAFLSCFAFFHNAFRSCIIKLGHVYFREIGDGTEKIILSLVRCDRDPAEVGSAQNVVTAAVDILKPKVVFSVGCCAGLHKDKAKLGDVVISRKLVICGNKKIVNDKPEWSYSRVDVSRNIGPLIRTAAHGWQPPLHNEGARDVKVHCDGEIVTGVDLKNSPKECKELLDRFPDSIAIEPQGQEVYLAAFYSGMEWVIIKGISHYADGSKHETKEWQRFSSVMAASVVNNILKPEVLKDWRRSEEAKTV